MVLLAEQLARMEFSALAIQSKYDKDVAEPGTNSVSGGSRNLRFVINLH